MANKQRELATRVAMESNYTGPKNAAEHYEVWSISGTQGPYKLDLTFASQNNEKGEINPKSNTLIWRHSKDYT